MTGSIRAWRMVAAIAALIVFALLSAPSATAGYWKQCGDQNKLGFGWFKARAHKISCPKARAAARKYTFNYSPGATPYGFHCGSRSIAEEIAAVRCGRVKGGVKQKVAFQVGA